MFRKLTTDYTADGRASEREHWSVENSQAAQTCELVSVGLVIALQCTCDVGPDPDKGAQRRTSDPVRSTNSRSSIDPIQISE